MITATFDLDRWSTPALRGALAAFVALRDRDAAEGAADLAELYATLAAVVAEELDQRARSVAQAERALLFEDDDPVDPEWTPD